MTANLFVETQGWRGHGPPTGRPVVMNRKSPQARGLYAWWPTMDYRGGMLFDRGLAGAHMRPVGTPVGAPIPVVGGAVDFQPSSNQYLIHNRCVLSRRSYPWSISFWARLREPAAGQSGGIFQEGNSGDGRMDIRIYTGGAPQLNYYNSWFGVQTAQITGPIYSGWGGLYHVVLICGHAADHRMYVNGRLVGSSTTSVANAASGFNQFSLGALTTGGTPAHYFLGELGDFRVYNRDIGAAGVWALWDPRTRWDLYGAQWVREPGFPALLLSADAAYMVLSTFDAPIVPGAATISADASVVVLNAGEAAVQPGAVALPADIAALLLAAGDGALIPGAVVLPAGSAELILSALDAGLATGAVAVSADAAVVVLEAGNAGLAAGGVTLAADVVEASLAAGEASLSPGSAAVPADAAELRLLASDAGVTTGAVTISAAAAVLIMSAVEAALAPGPIAVPADAAELRLLASDAGLAPGAVLVPASAAALLLAAGGAIVSAGSVVLPVDVAAMLLRAMEPAIGPGAVALNAPAAYLLLRVGDALIAIGLSVPACLVVDDAVLTTMTLADAPLAVLELADAVLTTMTLADAPLAVLELADAVLTTMTLADERCD